MKHRMPYSLIALSVALLGFAHYLPHLRVLTGKPIGHPIRLNINYTIGILCIFLPFTAWLAENNLGWVAEVMWVFISASGLAVVTFYVLDYLIDEIRSNRNERETNELRKRQADAERQRK